MRTNPESIIIFPITSIIPQVFRVFDGEFKMCDSRIIL